MVQALQEKLANDAFNKYVSFVKSKYSYFKTRVADVKFFAQLLEKYSPLPSFDIDMFLEANLKDKMKFPAQLLTKTAWDTFETFRNNKKISHQLDTGTKVAYSLKSTYDFIKNWQAKHPGEDFFSDAKQHFPPAITSGVQGFISPYFMALSKSYRKCLASLDVDMRMEFETSKELTDKANVVKKHFPKVYSLAKKMFKDDIV
jgi:hypothetical protein